MNEQNEQNDQILSLLQYNNVKSSLQTYINELVSISQFVDTGISSNLSAKLFLPNKYKIMGFIKEMITVL